jgi:hypothetical protein
MCGCDSIDSCRCAYSGGWLSPVWGHKRMKETLRTIFAAISALCSVAVLVLYLVRGGK